jgi:hypothetical protein
MSNTYNNVLVFCTCTGGPKTGGGQYSVATDIAKDQTERGELIRERGSRQRGLFGARM